MRQLSNIQSIAMALGALMMVIGVGCVTFAIMPQITAIVFAVGACTFAAMQMCQTYDGNSFTIKRLRRIMVIGDLCFIIAALLMLENVFQIIRPLMATSMEGVIAWTRYFMNNWVVALLVGAILELYTTHRISYELKKEQE